MARRRFSLYHAKIKPYLYCDVWALKRLGWGFTEHSLLSHQLTDFNQYQNTCPNKSSSMLNICHATEKGEIRCWLRKKYIR